MRRSASPCGAPPSSAACASRPTPGGRSRTPPRMPRRPTTSRDVTMPRAYLFTAFGGPETQSFAELPRPVPGPGQLLVAVRAAGVNPADWKQRTGHRSIGAPVTPLPSVFGREVAGVVEEVGGDVTGFAIGDAVFGHPVTGAYTEFTLLPADATAHKPDAVSWADAATLPVAAATAYDAIHQFALPTGATLLVNGVGGGVGVAAAQIARHDG